MASIEYNRRFIQEAFAQHPLDAAIEWIVRHMEPEDVFERETLAEWARGNGFVEEFDEIT